MIKQTYLLLIGISIALTMSTTGLCESTILLANQQVKNVSDEKNYPIFSKLDVEIPSNKEFYRKDTFTVPPIYTQQNKSVILRHLATSSRWLLMEDNYASMAEDISDQPLSSLYNEVWRLHQAERKSYWIEYCLSNGSTKEDALKMAADCERNERITQITKNFDVEIAEIHHSDSEMKLCVSKSWERLGFTGFDIGDACIFIRPNNLPAGKKLDQLIVAIAQRVYDELKAVVKSSQAKTTGFDLSLMPTASVKYGSPELKLWNGFQLGIYKVAAYANPGEDGFAYIKGYEMAKHHPLLIGHSLSDVKQHMGWSKNLKQNFLYHREITIYTGDWEHTYPACIELWFEPKDPKKPERKLVEANYMINGWER